MPENSPSSLDNLHIASPCHASWDAMTGDDNARFCKTCQKNVFNLSLMTRADAENLIRAKEGNLCVRFAQREDGTILTQDCPVGFERAKQGALRPWRAFAAGIAAVLATLSSLLGIAPRALAQPPLNITPSRVREVKGEMVAPPTAVRMGDVAVKCVAPPTGELKATMGKPSVKTLQGEPQAIPKPTPQATSQPIRMMGRISAHPTTTVMGSPPPVPVKTAPKTKKSAPKTKRAAR